MKGEPDKLRMRVVLMYLVACVRRAVPRHGPAAAYSMKSDMTELLRLETELSEHDQLYYNEAAPRVSDAEYDALKARAEAIRARAGEEERRVVGAKLSGTFAAARPHTTRMLSLDNLKRKPKESDEDMIERWLVKTRKASKGEDLGGIVAEPKLDGLSVSLRYEGGVLTQAATRGDGTQGDDVTANAQVVHGVVTSIGADDVEVRGEVMMSKRTFARLKDELGFTSARNAAAGSLRQLESATTEARNLTFVAHDVVGVDEAYSRKRKLLREWGFLVASPSALCETALELATYFDELQSLRSTDDFEWDGAVYKVESQVARDTSGATAKAPRWAVAHKFDDEAPVAATRLLGIKVSVGKRGGLTPVADLEPVRLGDVQVAKATLHNTAYVRTKLEGVRTGDPVLVRRAGDVIPQVVGPAATTDSGEPGFGEWLPPLECPSCGTPTVELSDGERECPAAFDCPAQAGQRLSHLISRSGLDLGAGLGKKKLQQLVDVGLVKDGADLLGLESADEIAALDGWGKKSAAKLLDAIAARRQRPVPLATFVYALGAPRLGKSTAAAVAAASGTWGTLWAALTDDTPEAAAERDRLSAVRGIGPATVEALRAFAVDPRERDVAERTAACLAILDDPGVRR